LQWRISNIVTEATSGSVLFGGVDTARYTGDLISVDVYPTDNSRRVTSFTVAWTSLSATSSSGTDVLTSSDYAEAAILDSGTTITLLPDKIAEIVFEELGAQVSNELGAVIVPCDLEKNTGTLDYTFGGIGGPTIKVQMSQLVLPITTETGEVPRFTNRLSTGYPTSWRPPSLVRRHVLAISICCLRFGEQQDCSRPNRLQRYQLQHCFIRQQRSTNPKRDPSFECVGCHSDRYRQPQDWRRNCYWRWNSNLQSNCHRPHCRQWIRQQ